MFGSGSLTWFLLRDAAVLPQVLSDQPVVALSVAERTAVAALDWVHERGGPVGPVLLCAVHREVVIPLSSAVQDPFWQSQPSLACGQARWCGAQIWVVPSAPLRGLPSGEHITEALTSVLPESRRVKVPVVIG